MIKKTVSLFIVVLIALSFSACENKSNNKAQKHAVETMVLNEKYTLNVGDEIRKVTNDATIKISQNSESDDAFYELTKGDAEIVRR